MGNPAKDIRKQVRNVVNEILQEVLSTELVKHIEIKLRNEMNARLNIIDERQKDIQGYMVRQSARPAEGPKLPESQKTE